MKILIVDDSKMSRRLIRGILEQDLNLQTELREASNGQEAIALLEKETADLVFLDLTMPGLSGFDVLEEIKRRSFQAQVFVLSADIQTKAREKVLSLGAKDFIAKPVCAQVLREVLRSHGIINE